MSEPDELNAAQQQRARALLDQGAEQLDHVTLQRLARARHAALHGETRNPRRRVAPWIGAAVAASLVAAITLNGWMGSERAPYEVAAMDLELLTAREEFEFYQDLDFYEWLDEAKDEG